MSLVKHYWLVLVGLAFFISGCSEQNSLYTLQIEGRTMGTYYQIKLAEPKANLPNGEALQTKIDAVLQQVNQEMSTYISDSELSRFNQHSANNAISISDNLALVLEASLQLSEDSKGAFDVTVGPLVNLWGFGPEGRPEQRPTERELALTKAKIGYQHLSLSSGKLSKDLPDLYVDLSAIAKGHGVDRVADLLEAEGLHNYMVDIGGELRLKGHNDKGAGWRIAVEKPSAEQRAVQKIIEPGDNGLATSGDYRNYFEQDGVRYSHTINPNTGMPIANHIVSVSVITPTSMMADAYATAFTVMGVEQAMRFAENKQLAVYIIEKQGDEFVEHISSAFVPFVVQ
ncbi:thiamin biosynthesis lipoprotein ApbE [Agarivorans sp. Toyoura001]|uniref:FAD:protein FMN transferase n=1 Tax=Agarivorans sp. Toyoura001 TaxID=2283141 RepID=UPI0010D0F750|nr:FAD:protein FMN transferase [Agarivorans sp. Toyoura001]GDY24914.1 thiamin biosynthesis lipoprotein ApbE [Agarivorans sp. Toyoura001]